MKTVQIEFSKYELVNFLWPELIEDYGFDKARKIVSQAIDLQKMNGTKNSTMPIIFSGTGGLALIPIQILEKEEFVIDLRNRLKCNVVQNEINAEKYIVKSYDALNDFYFKSVEEDISPTNQIQIEIDNEKVNEYKGDGLIIATSTGSTAYSMAAGGPIVHPNIDAMIINPICPMSLASRPIVIPNTSKVIIKPVKKNKGEIKLWRDGSKCMTIKETYYCEIKKGQSPCKIIKFKKSKSYYSTLIKKLDWKGDLSLKNFKN